MEWHPYRWVSRYILGIGDDEEIYEDSTRKKLMMTITIILGGLVLLIFGFYAFIDGHWQLGILDVSVCIVFIVTLALIRRGMPVAPLARMLVFMLLVFYFYLFATGLGSYQSYIWYFTFPIFSLFYLGVVGGSILSLTLAALTILVTVFNDVIPGLAKYPEGSVFRLIASYLLVYIMMVVSETTRLKTKEKLEETLGKMNELAIRDGLTGLYNRRYMDEILAIAMRHESSGNDRLAFLMLDLDHFKKYNDTYGHRAGDDALVTFAEILLTRIRRNTDYAFRYGGEEFSMILYGADQKTAIRMADEVLVDLRSRNLENKETSAGYLTTSVGIVVVPKKSGLDTAQVIHRADEALYEAKEQGRDRYILKTLGDT